RHVRGSSRLHRFKRSRSRENAEAMLDTLAVVRARHALLVLLVCFAATPRADAMCSPCTVVLSHPIFLTGTQPDAQQHIAFDMIDPGGATPGACYYSQKAAAPGNVGSVTIRVVDAAGDVVFVDNPIGADVAGINAPPAGLVGFAPGHWHVLVDATGSFRSMRI